MPGKGGAMRPAVARERKTGSAVAVARCGSTACVTCSVPRTFTSMDFQNDDDDAPATGATAPRAPAQCTTTSMGPAALARSAVARRSAARSSTSTAKVTTAVDGWLARRACAVTSRCVCRRPSSATVWAPASAKADAACLPRPAPPPVMSTTLLAIESSGRDGEMKKKAKKKQDKKKHMVDG